MSRVEAEMLELFGKSWRILPLDAKPEDKFRADMVLASYHDFPSGAMSAYGYIYNDSRELFHDGQDIRTSAIKNVYREEGVTYIETRNTIYRLIEKE